MTHTHRAYIALVTIFLLSLTLTSFAITATQSSFYSRMNSTDLENRVIAKHAARACGAAVRILIVQDSSYYPDTDGDVVRLSKESTCLVLPDDSGESVIAFSRVGHTTYSERIHR